jgi:hypothetical protein
LAAVKPHRQQQARSRDDHLAEMMAWLREHDLEPKAQGLESSLSFSRTHES